MCVVKCERLDKQAAAAAASRSGANERVSLCNFQSSKLVRVRRLFGL